MVANEHQVPGPEVGIEAPRGIGEDQGLHPQGGHHPHREGHLAQGVAFVGVEPALAEQDPVAGQAPPAEAPLVAGAGGRGKMGQLLIREAVPARPAGRPTDPWPVPRTIPHSGLPFSRGAMNRAHSSTCSW